MQTVPILAASLLLLATLAAAQAPLLLDFQGRLTNTTGAVITGSNSMTFRIYNVYTSGSALWTETQSVNVQNGNFDVLLGGTTSLSGVSFTQPLYLGVQVGSTEMAPRLNFTQAPFAMSLGGVLSVSGNAVNSTTGVLDVAGQRSRVRFHYDTLADRPDPTTYHGMFAHVHNPTTGDLGAAYFAHAGAWLRLLNENPSGNVGIGTLSPTQRLEVNGSVNVTGNVTIAGTGNGLAFPDGTRQTTAAAGGGTIGGSGTTNYVPKFTAGTTLGNSLIYQHPAGTVGIGTTTPSRTLDIPGGSFAAASVETYGPNVEAATLIPNGVNSGVMLKNQPSGRFFRMYTPTTTNFAIRDETGGVDRFTINSTGDMRIDGTPYQAASSKINTAAATTYYVNTRRYHFEATGAVDGTTVSIDNTLLDELCSDADGCTVVTGIRDYDTTTYPQTTASRGPFKLFVAPLSGANIPWRLGTQTADVQSRDHDGAVAHVIDPGWGCYFTDGEYSAFVGTDSVDGFGLLNWNNNIAAAICTLDIED